MIALCIAFSAIHAAPNNSAKITSDIREFQTPLQNIEKPVTIILHQNNSGAKVTVPSGAIIKVILETKAASTGFDWIPLLSSPDILTFENKNILEPSSHLIGSFAKESWSFKATASGQTALTFSLARSWEKNVDPVATVQFEITVLDQ